MPTDTPDAQRRPQPFSIARRCTSVGHALHGIGYVLRTQHNAWIHAAATIGVVIAGVWLRISGADWRWLILAIALVWAAEAFNTAIEFLCDVVAPEHHPAVARAKDIAAGAVLICALGAAAVGALTFIPYLLPWLR